MVQYVRQLIVLMDKKKLIEGFMWLSGASLSIIIDASLLYIGFNNVRHGSYTIIIIGFLLLPIVFFFAFKGIRIILDAIF